MAIISSMPPFGSPKCVMVAAMAIWGPSWKKWATDCRRVVLSLFLSLRLQSKESSCGDRGLEIKMA